MKVEYVEGIDEIVKLRVHGNKPTCNTSMLEINPAIGCQFQCQYCNAYTQEKENHFMKVKIYKDYPDYLEKYIKENLDNLKGQFFYFSPKIEAFQPALISSDISFKILSILKKYEMKCIIVTKCGELPYKIKKLLIEMKDLVQILISCSMPNEKVREIIEPGAAPISDRLKFASFCINNDIKVTSIFSPIFPVDQYSYIKKYIDSFYSMGITHFRLNFAEITKESYEKLVELLPFYKKEFEDAYISDDAEKTHWNIPYTNKQAIRYFPSIEFMKDAFKTIREYGESKGDEVTFSVCNSLCAKGKLEHFNDYAFSKGMGCIGYKW